MVTGVIIIVIMAVIVIDLTVIIERVMTDLFYWGPGANMTQPISMKTMTMTMTMTAFKPVYSLIFQGICAAGL